MPDEVTLSVYSVLFNEIVYDLIGLIKLILHGTKHFLFNMSCLLFLRVKLVYIALKAAKHTYDFWLV